MNKKLSIAVAVTSLLMPLTTFAVTLLSFPTQVTDLGAFWDGVFKLLWTIFAGFAVVMFVVAGFLFLAAQGDASKIKDARNALLWGAVGVAIGILAFSIPLIIQNVLHI